MTHGDDQGLKLPTACRADPGGRGADLAQAGGESRGAGARRQGAAARCAPRVRLHVDDREQYTPGWKYNEHELRGVPLRLEVGPQRRGAGRGDERAPRWAGQGVDPARPRRRAGARAARGDPEGVVRGGRAVPRGEHRDRAHPRRARSSFRRASRLRGHAVVRRPRAGSRDQEPHGRHAALPAARRQRLGRAGRARTVGGRCSPRRIERSSRDDAAARPRFGFRTGSAIS